MENQQEAPVIGIIGGSGLYQIAGLTNTEWKTVKSPFGEPSDDILFGELDGVQLRFLPRHGRGHVLTPSQVNYRANIDALKRAGCTDIISMSAVGGLKEETAPGVFVLVDQFIDRTFAREKTFFGNGLVAHVSMADPVCPVLNQYLASALQEANIKHIVGGTYIAIEGPQFSTKAESELYRNWGCTVIGMTNMPEAKLAREAELAYSSVAMVTDFDCWHPDHDNVTVDMIIKVLHDNADNAKTLIKHVVPKLKHRKEVSPAHTALDFAIITQKESQNKEMIAKLDAVAGRVLK